MTKEMEEEEIGREGEKKDRNKRVLEIWTSKIFLTQQPYFCLCDIIITYSTL